MMRSACGIEAVYMRYEVWGKGVLYNFIFTEFHSKRFPVTSLRFTELGLISDRLKTLPVSATPPQDGI